MAPSLFLDVRFNQLTPRAQAIVLSARWQRRLRLEQQLEPPWNMQTLLHRCVSNGWGLAHRCQQPRMLPSHSNQFRPNSASPGSCTIIVASPTNSERRLASTNTSSYAAAILQEPRGSIFAPFLNFAPAWPLGLIM